MKVSYDKKGQVIKAQQVSESSRSRLNTDQGIVTETALKLFFSFVIGVSGVTSLIKLIPYYNTQQAKLTELRSQVQETEVRVSKLRAELNRNFDPQQTQSLIEEYSGLTTPHRIHIFVRDNNNPVSSDSKIVSNPKVD